MSTDLTGTYFRFSIYKIIRIIFIYNNLKIGTLQNSSQIYKTYTIKTYFNKINK